MTDQEHASIKILARIIVEGIVSTVKHQQHERETKGLNGNLDSSLHLSDGAVGDSDLSGKLKIIS